MSKNDWQNLKALGVVFSLGTTIAAGIVVGYFLGDFIDGKLGTSPWFTFILLVVGVGAAFKSAYDAMFPEKKGGD
ncbi:MAG: AtpZ/AtpI family protein [Clostridia bacterium]|nr:AtpZ/AtpI family protein [Clostridia bacterium]